MATAERTLRIARNEFPLTDLLTVRLPLLILLLVPLFAPTILPSSYLLSRAVTAAIFVMVANGLHIIFSYAGQLSLAHTTLWGLGAYTAALLIIHYDVPTYGVLPAAALAGAAGAVAIGIPAFRTAGFSFAIITFAFAEIMRQAANNWSDLTEGSTGLFINATPTSLGPIKFDTFDHLTNFYYLTVAFAYLSLIGVWAIRQSSLGRSFVAIRENEDLAQSVGINVYLNKLIAFALSGVFAGVAGVFFMYNQQHIEPGPLSPFTGLYTIQFLLMILIGGRFSMLGPTIGVVIAIFMPEVINTLFGGFFDPGRIQVVFGVMLVFAVLFAPHGAAGQAQRGHRTFFAVLRAARGQGRPWAVASGMALACGVVPSLAARWGVLNTMEEA